MPEHETPAASSSTESAVAPSQWVRLCRQLWRGLLFGLAAAVQHYILRFWLWQTHTFPWKAQLFLDDTTTRIFLRRVGGGYSFVHRLLLDHFADLSTGPTLASATPPSATSHPPSANTS